MCDTLLNPCNYNPTTSLFENARKQKMKLKFCLLLYFCLIINGCSVQRFAIRSMIGVLDNSMNALYEESDLKLAEQAIASDLKLLEGLIKGDPHNEKLLFLATQGFAAYTLGFVEDIDPKRAQKLYLRGRDYGLQILTQKKEFKRSLNKDIESFKNSLNSFTQKDVPVLFWTANNWAGWINVSFTNPQALADLPKVQLLMQKVIELDEDYFYGGAHLFFGTIYAARPPLLGGDIQKAKFHFEKCFEQAENKFLLPYVYYAKFYATRISDQKLFEKTLNQVLKTPDDILIDQQLPNAIAKQKARRLLTQVDEIF